MKTLRKLIVKLFVGYYKIGYGHVPRASMMIMPAMLIPMLLEIFFKTGVILWHYYLAGAFVLISFVYLHVWPAKTKELDPEQLKQYVEKLKGE